jgi:antitoxin component YwqK of YwqJK toxin-antitoxin module
MYSLYFNDGLINFEGVYVKDLKDGFWKFFNEDGSLKLEVEYDNGILLTTIDEER